jgi:hypothetical protein
MISLRHYEIIENTYTIDYCFLKKKTVKLKNLKIWEKEDINKKNEL